MSAPIAAGDVMREVAERYGDDFGPQQVAGDTLAGAMPAVLAGGA